jgi:hypothetical protein
MRSRGKRDPRRRIPRKGKHEHPNPGRWLTARLRKLERASAAKPQTTGQISSDDEDASVVLISGTGQPVETTLLSDASEDPDDDTFTDGKSSKDRLCEE